MDSVKEKISSYLASHPYLNLATLSPEGRPVAHTVAYVSEGSTVWFLTDGRSRKALNAAGNPSVAYTVDEDYAELGKIQGVQMEGRALRVEDEAEAGRVTEMMVAKFPQMRGMAGKPTFVMFRVEPVAGYFLDNTVCFGHRDAVSYEGTAREGTPPA